MPPQLREKRKQPGVEPVDKSMGIVLKKREQVQVVRYINGVLTCALGRDDARQMYSNAVNTFQLVKPGIVAEQGAVKTRSKQTVSDQTNQLT
jgi:hypothetical protein